MRLISYRDAINEAIYQEMEIDPNVFIYGIDVADHKRIFGSTRGLVEKFGMDRCFSTPLCEDSMTGFGLGAAINGLRPIHVHMRIDFLLLAINQLANMVSSYTYSTCCKLKVPLVIRAVVGRGWGQSFQHSKTMHSVFAHIPGLKVVSPTTPKDAKLLLISAIRDDNPVIVIEHRLLYETIGEVPEIIEPIQLGTQNLLRKGTDITILANSWMNVEAIKAAEIMEKNGINVEIIDLRCISPMDDTLILESIRKTGHCIIADNDWLYCGFSAEIAARISEKCFNDLKSPVSRIGFAPTPCPCTRPLEEAFYPNTINIIRIIEEKLKLKHIGISKESLYSYENKFKGPF